MRTAIVKFSQMEPQNQIIVKIPKKVVLSDIRIEILLHDWKLLILPHALPS